MNNPIVYPDIDAQGVETSPLISALFDREMEEGNIDYRQIVLIKKETDLSENTIKNIPVEVTTQRFSLTSNNEDWIEDDGTSLEAGKLYRSKFILTPRSPLDQNSDYSVIIPKEFSLRSVFDVRPTTPGQSPCIEARGPFTGLIEDEYQITITEDGTQSKTKYLWKRLSDNYQVEGLKGRRRFVELDGGLRIVFPTGEYKTGDSFLIKVIPEQRIQKIYAWNFSTGNHNHTTPESERSNSSIDLPVNVPEETTQSSSMLFSCEEITPYTGQSMIELAKKATLILGQVTVRTREEQEGYNEYKMEVIGGALSGAETISLVDNLITLSIEEGITLNQKVVELINTAFQDLEATTLLSNLPALLVPPKRFSPGTNKIKIELTFSKDIDPASVTSESVKLFSEDLINFKKEKLYYSHTVSGNTLTIQIED